MGHSELNAQTTMKFALVVCFVITIAGVAEACLAGFGTPQSTSNPGLYGFAAAPSNFAPKTNFNDRREKGPGPKPNFQREQYGKRSADADPEADADAHAYWG